LRPFDDICFFLLRVSQKGGQAAGRKPFPPPKTAANLTLTTCGWEPSTLKQNPDRNNRGFYWIVTGRDTWLKPPFVFWVVTVITFSPLGRGLVKWENVPSPRRIASSPLIITRAPGSVLPRTSIEWPCCTKSVTSSAMLELSLGLGRSVNLDPLSADSLPLSPTERTRQ